MASKGTLTSEVYASNLLQVISAHALWSPAPTDNGEIQIGDVGYIENGRFIRILNVRPDDVPPVNFCGHTFSAQEPLTDTKALLIQNDSLVAASYTSRGVEKTEIQLRVEG